MTEANPTPPAMPGLFACPRCGYDFTGLPLGAPCPECGACTSVEITEATLTDSRPCLQCGYDLNGLQVSGRCPECGREVARSLQGNLLVFSAGAFVRRLVTGATLVLWGLALFCISLAMSVVGFNTPRGFGASALELVAYAGKLIPIASTGCSLAGWWLLSSPDPALIGEDRSTSARKVLRITVIISAVALGTVTAIELAGGRGSMGQLSMALRRTSQAGAPDIIGGLAVGVNALVWPIKTIASLKYVRALSLRIPSPSLANRASNLVLFAAIGTGVFLLCIPLFIILADSLAGVLVIPMCGTALGVLVWWCTYATLIGGLRGDLSQIARRVSRSAGVGP